MYTHTLGYNMCMHLIKGRDKVFRGRPLTTEKVLS